MAYTGAYVFGDSLVDSGNALKLAKWYGNLTFSDLPDGAPTPEKGYFQGRFADGYNFADLISNIAIGAVSKPVFPFGFKDPWLGIPIDPFGGDPSGNNLNFAYGGAQLLQGDEVVPELDGQTDAFRNAVDGDADPNALYLVTMGGNDVRSLAPAGSDPESQAAAYAQLDEAAAEMLHELSQLVDDGARTFLITGVPDVGIIPNYDRDGNGVLEGVELVRSAAATNYSIYLDTLIRTKVVPGLQAEGATVTYVPIMNYTDANGQTVTGALKANLPMLEALNGLPPGTLSSDLLEHQNTLFFDHVHPNAQAHALLASYMQAKLINTTWVETKPLLGEDVDYRATGSIGAAGEVDKSVIAMVANTTYTFQALGVSTITPFVLGQLSLAALGSGALLADPALRLVSSGGTVVKSDGDSGAGLDSLLTYNAAAAGNLTLELSAVGGLTGQYILTATVTGAAMQSGNTYTVGSPTTLVIEGAGGFGTDVVKSSVSYALAAGSEIEVLRTTNDRGKTAINLTGNELDQTLVGNSAANVLEGKAGADVMTGGAGNDRFVLSSAALTDAGSIDRITDYARGDIVDVSQILNVASGTNVISGGYVRVTASGLIQVDVDGGANGWATLATVNGSGAVSVRYLSNGAAATTSVARVADTQASSLSAPAGTEARYSTGEYERQPLDVMAWDADHHLSSFWTF